MLVPNPSNHERAYVFLVDPRTWMMIYELWRFELLRLETAVQRKNLPQPRSAIPTEINVLPVESAQTQRSQHWGIYLKRKPRKNPDISWRGLSKSRHDCSSKALFSPPPQSRAGSLLGLELSVFNPEANFWLCHQLAGWRGLFSEPQRLHLWRNDFSGLLGAVKKTVRMTISAQC